MIAILARLRDHKEAVRKIVKRLAGLAATEREIALGQLMILAGLRHLSRTVEQETRKMPIHIIIFWRTRSWGRCSRGAWKKGVRRVN